jgi:hypothetical protein
VSGGSEVPSVLVGRPPHQLAPHRIGGIAAALVLLRRLRQQAGRQELRRRPSDVTTAGLRSAVVAPTGFSGTATAGGSAVTSPDRRRFLPWMVTTVGTSSASTPANARSE